MRTRMGCKRKTSGGIAVAVLLTTAVAAAVAIAWTAAPVVHAATTEGPTYELLTPVTVTPDPLCRSDADGKVDATLILRVTFDVDTSTTAWGDYVTATGSLDGVDYNRPRTKTVTQLHYWDKYASLYLNGVPEAQRIFPSGGHSDDGGYTGGDFVYSATYSPTLPPSGAYDGFKWRTIYIDVFEKRTATPTTYTEYWMKSGRKLTYIGTSATGVTGTPVTTVLHPGAQTTADCTVDLQPPVVSLWPDSGGGGGPVSVVRQGQSVPVHVRILQGSSSQPYSLRAVAVGPGGATYEATVAGTLQAGAPHPSPSNPAATDGIAPEEDRAFALEIPSDAPTGTYAVAVSVDSTDLLGVAWPTASLDGGTFTVTAQSAISAQTFVISDFAASGFGVAQNFTAVQSRKSKTITTTPSAFHVASVITVSGASALATATLTLDPAFAYFDSTGVVHVFVGDTGGAGFDLGNPTNLDETTLPAVVSGGTVTVDLSSLGTLAPPTTVYLRARCTYAPQPNVLPSATTTYTFGSSVVADGGAWADGSSAVVVLQR